jgi:hypothetical protein
LIADDFASCLYYNRRMFNLRSLLLALAVLWVASGCETNRVLTLKPDGSGQISEHYMASLDSFKKEPKPGAEPAPQQGLDMSQPRPTAETVGKAAAKFGEGVKLTSFKVLQTKDMLGYDAVYDFPDVNKLDAGVFMMHESKMGPPGGAPAGGEGVKRFHFTKGPVNELTIPIKEIQGEEEKKGPGAPKADDDPKQRAAFIEAIKHLHIRTAIRVVGKIEETNSHFRKDNEVVLSEMNLKGMSADPKYAQLFKDAASGKTSPQEPPEDEKYIKHEKADVVKIRFK